MPVYKVYWLLIIVNLTSFVLNFTLLHLLMLDAFSGKFHSSCFFSTQLLPGLYLYIASENWLFMCF